MFAALTGALRGRRLLLGLLVAFALPGGLIFANGGLASTSGAKLTMDLPPFDYNVTVGIDDAYALATLKDASGNPITNTPVTFSVISGPDDGTTDTETTDSSGFAFMTFTGSASGQDIVVASANVNGEVVHSNTHETVNWDAPITDTTGNLDISPSTSIGAGTTYDLSSFGDVFNDPGDNSPAPDSNSDATDYQLGGIWGDGNSVSGGATQDGTSGNYSLSGTHSYDSSGTYNPSVTVADGDTSTNALTYSGTVYVWQATGGQSLTGLQDGVDSGTQTVATIADPNPNASASDYSATIDWGDGTSTTDASVIPDPNNTGQFLVQGSHTYDQAASSYDVQVTVTGPDSSQETVDSSASVTDQDFTVSGVGPLPPSNTDQGLSGVQVATFNDPNPDATASEYSASINWGDGSGADTTTPSISSVQCAQNVSGTCFSVTGSHTYGSTSGSPYTVSVTVSDNSDSSNSHTTNDSTETASVSGDPAITAQNIGTLDGSTTASGFSGNVATFNDPVPSVSADEYSATIDWGDGTSTTDGTITPYTTGCSTGTCFDVSGSHKYATDNGGTPYTVTVTITDADNSSNTQTVTDSESVTSVPSALSGSPGAYGTTARPVTEDQSPNDVLAAITDTNSSDTASQLSATVDWGDGSSSSTGDGRRDVTIVRTSRGHFTVTGKHAYDEADGSWFNTDHLSPYGITVTVTRNANPSADTTTQTPSAEIIDAPLQAGSASVSVRNRVASGVFRFSDANRLATAGGDFPNGARVSWGDGTTNFGVPVSGSSGSFSVTKSHTYGGPGTYTVTMFTEEDSGQGVTVTKRITVS